jgi:hypothetical protein
MTDFIFRGIAHDYNLVLTKRIYDELQRFILTLEGSDPSHQYGLRGISDNN